MTVAAIDVGTNTVRLLVPEVERDLEVTRLGQGVDETKTLASGAIDRTADAVARFASRARDLGARRIRVAGTSALRDARNADVFVQAVRARSGLTLEILSGDEEGRLAFAGATSGLPGRGPYLVIDIGGGSTEFVRGTTSVDAVSSADVGSVRLRERCLAGDPPSDEQVNAARDAVRRALAGVERDVPVRGDETLVGVAGTVTTLAALVLGLERYEPARVHHTRIGARDVAAWSERLLRMRIDDVRALGSMHPGRADVIAAGVLILHEAVTRWRFGDLLVSESDILDGLVEDLR